MKNLFSIVILTLSFSALAEVKFSNDSEVALLQTGGNSVVETYNAKTSSKWTTDKRIYFFGGHYTLGASEITDETTGTTKKTESARNWDINAKFERILNEKVGIFLALQFEGDEFSGFKQRENIDFGAAYTLIKTDKTQSSAELGLRYTIEKKTTRNEDDEDVFDYTKGRLYYEISHQKSESLNMKLWAEYLPNFTEADDYIVSVEPSIAFILSSTFSLKTAYKAVYDNEPNVKGNEYTDTTFTTSLLAKF